MSRVSSSLYAILRFSRDYEEAFHDGRETPPEHLLQAIWQYQRIHRDRLKTLGGRSLFILHPGYLNREAGPDFRGAVVQFDDEAPVSGDVEVDTRPGQWVQHRHHENPAFGNVVLHVVWNAGAVGSRAEQRPILELKPFIDDSLANIVEFLNPGEVRHAPPFIQGKCCAPLSGLSPTRLEELLTQAALLRFQLQADKFTARAREVGWDQALWEGLFRGLGYKHNQWPMLRLAELSSLWHRANGTPFEDTARLFGLSGLLPAEFPTKSTSASKYLRRLWDCWWRERDSLSDHMLPTSLWRMAGVRPSNHPHRRLALAAQWVNEGTLPDQLRRWIQCDRQDSELPASLMQILHVKADVFWMHHYTLRSRYMPKNLPLIGENRVTDLAANVILPWLWAGASKGGRKAACLEIQHRYLAWPAGSDNARLKLARQRLFGKNRLPVPQRMATQQGVLQIVRDFCDQSNSVCDGCRFPEVARQFQTST